MEIGIRDNQEDSIIMNKSSIDRGLYRSMSLKKYEDISKKSIQTTNEDEFGIKDKSLVIGMNEKEKNYDKINDKGFAPEETKLVNGDIIICKTSAISDGNNKKYRDESTSYKSNLPGYVDKVWSKIYDGDGYQMIKMRIRSERTPMVGDKFCMDDSHDILTINGWKNITKLNMNDMVATLQEGNELKYCHPLEIQTLEHNGDMCLIETDEVNLCVTPNHRMYVSDDGINYKFELAEDIYDKPKYYLKNANVKTMYMNEINELENNINHDLNQKNINTLSHFCLNVGYSLSIINNKIVINKDIQSNRPVVSYNKTIPFNGLVYCCTVPGDGIIYVRRNNVTVWTGNCSRHGIFLPKSL